MSMQVANFETSLPDSSQDVNREEEMVEMGSLQGRVITPDNEELEEWTTTKKIMVLALSCPFFSLLAIAAPLTLYVPSLLIGHAIRHGEVLDARNSTGHDAVSEYVENPVIGSAVVLPTAACVLLLILGVRYYVNMYVNEQYMPLEDQKPVEETTREV
jgi:hypothetical protein